MKGYYTLRKRALELLRTRLPKRLYYHDYAHTLDVLNACNAYLRRYKVPAHQAKLLRLGAIMHDIGFTVSDENHEANGAAIAEKLMKELSFKQADINAVQNLIMATKIPQQPQNTLEKILCDADLDYLGRKDFYVIGDKLFKELKIKGIVSTRSAWNKLQVTFLEAHQYHTRFARRYRSPQKEKYLLELKKGLTHSA